MSAYLQRLYDVAGAVAAVDARPAQRSSSPLLAVDQRLASATFAASFLLGMPGETDAEQGPAPEPEALTLPDPLRRNAVSRDQTPVRAPVPRPAPTGTPVPDVKERVALRPRADGHIGSPAGPAPSREPGTVPPNAAAAARAERPPVAEHATRRREEAQPPPPEVQPLPRRVDPAGPLAQRPEPGRPTEPAVTTRPTEPAVTTRPTQPAVATRPDVPRPVAEVAPPPALAGTRAEPGGPAPLLHPVPVPAPEPLPPPAAPRAAEPAELAEQVRRLVREAMSREVTRPGPTRERESGIADSRVPASRPTMAEAISVIGPLDRPARATTLYGLRLR